MLKKCSSHIEGHAICRDGFPQSPGCVAPPTPRDGKPPAYTVPLCCDEELCGRVFDKTGGKPDDALVRSNS